MVFKVGHVLRPAIERFTEKTQASPNGCIEWIGGTAGPGDYGYFYEGRTSLDQTGRIYAHRWAYKHFVGPIRDGMQIDHLCRNPRCVNPEHLEQVTPEENYRRSHGNHRKTHCPAGHPYSGANLRVYRGIRLCRACRRLHDGHTQENNATKTHCKHGHPFDAVNTYVNPAGRRKCRTCQRAAKSAYLKRKAEAKR